MLFKPLRIAVAFAALPLLLSVMPPSQAVAATPIPIPGPSNVQARNTEKMVTPSQKAGPKKATPRNLKSKKRKVIPRQMLKGAM
jgi:hypothetical protein